MLCWPAKLLPTNSAPVGEIVMWKSYPINGSRKGSPLLRVAGIEARDPAAFRLVLDNIAIRYARERWPPYLEADGHFGQRLNSSYFPVDTICCLWRGAWLFHMLREMLRDEDKSRSGSPIEIHEEKFTRSYGGYSKNTLESICPRAAIAGVRSRLAKSL